MSGPMVRALLDGRKTQTRRLATSPLRKVCPGDRLWVRETCVIECDREYIVESVLPTDRPVKCVDGGFDWGHYHLIPHYKATEPEPHIVPPDLEDETDDKTRWRPSIYMPRWASRLTLTVTEARLQRLQHISADDCVCEGISPSDVPGIGSDMPLINAFHDLWNSLHGAEAWDNNPEVIALTFTVQKRNIDSTDKAA